jgi:NTE family protein
MTTESPRTGLALSGGGYRATAFHLGTLKQLHKLGILNKIDVPVHDIRRASITGAYYCTQIDKDFDTFYNALYNALLTKDVIKKTLFSWLGFTTTVPGLNPAILHLFAFHVLRLVMPGHHDTRFCSCSPGTSLSCSR